MNDYETRRLENIKRNKALISELGIPKVAPSTTKSEAQPAAKRRKIEKPAALPSRTSARIASAPARPSYNEDDLMTKLPNARSSRVNTKKPTARTKQDGAVASNIKDSDDDPPAPYDLDTLRTSWSSWTPSAPPPTLDAETGTYHFPSHPTFTPNLSPSSILRQGAFGGTYFRPYYSKVLKTTIEDDYKELPEDWYAGLNVETYLTSTTYDADINKFHVACGQTIEEWEAAGWIRHEYDVRGWFQWYCRFFLGRRCADDERQISRWRKCVGETGRWRRMLLKRYKEAGVRSVADEEGEDLVEEGKRDVSPVMHQTCWHWAWEVRQGELDELWAGT